MTFVAAPTLKRWIAMLCIAVMALVVVGHSDIASASFENDACCDISSQLGDDGDDGQAPAGASHHCCCTHPVSDPIPGAMSSVACVGEDMETPLSDRRAPSGLQDGPERPPRASAS